MSVMERIENLGAMFISEFLKLRDILKRSTASFQTLIYTIETLGITMKSMMNGPIGDMANLAVDLGEVFTFFLLGPLSFALFPSLWFCACFSKNTKIKIDSNNSIPISDIQLGESIEMGKVEGILVFKNINNKPFYKLSDDYITDEHLVKYKKDWIFVKDHPKSINTGKIDKYLYCLCTSTNKISSNTNIYTDWNMTNNTTNWLSEKSNILKDLNNLKDIDKIEYDINHCYQEGFALNNYKKQNNIEDLLDASDINILSIGIWLSDKNVKWYKNKYTNNIVTGSTLINEYDKWIPVYISINHIQIYEDLPEYIINYITYDGIINDSNFRYRDILETHNSSIINKYNMF
jgi:hypothetical protein